MIDETTQPGKNVHAIWQIASDELARVHGPKMDGPRNQNERVLLTVIELAREIINDEYDLDHDSLI
jgi:hypothetical protein